ncbi:MAG: serine hydrolase domain-containing protein, partial [Bacteroidota bacterium]
MKRHQTIMDRVTALSNMALVDQPGESWHYSASPDILAALIEVFSGKNPAEFLEERLFAPLGMKDTGYNLEENQHDRLVEVFFPNPKDESGGFYQKTPLTGNTVYGGTHGLFSTASDYMNFLRMIENQGSFEGKRLLSRKTIELMSANHTRDIYLPGTGYGLGFAVRTNVGASKTLTSKGELYWSGLYCTYFMVDPEEDMIGILMTQTFPFNGNLGSQFKRMVYQAIAD